MKKLILSVLGAVALLGCGGGSGGGGSDSTDPRIAYVNASPDAGPLDFYLNDSRKASSVPYGTATDFRAVANKDYDIAVRAADDAETLWSETKTFTPDDDYVVLAVGLRTPPTDETQTPPVVENEKRLVIALGNVDRTAPTGNRARLVVVHAFVRKPGFGTPTIDFRNPGDTPVVNTQGIAFGVAAPIDVDSGTQTFQVRQNGTEQVFVEREFTGASALAAGSVYLAVVSGIEDGTGEAAPEIRLIKLPTR